MIVIKDDIINGLNEIRLSKKPVCIHSSLKSFGIVKGGPKTIIEGVLEKECTIIVPTFSYDYEISVPNGVNPPLQNGYDLDNKDILTKGIDKIFSNTSNEIHYTMGIIPKYVLSIRGRVRGNHPMDSFSAIGPNAEDYIKDQDSKNVYAPLIKLCEDDGYLVLIGVDLTRATIIHYAENIAGRNLFIRWANNHIGNPIAVNVGGCSDGFNNLDPFVKSIEKKVRVGNSLWRVFHAKSFAKIIAKVITSNPEVTHCDDPNCIRCEDAVKGGPII